MKEKVGMAVGAEVNIGLLPLIKCSCGSDEFRVRFQLRKISVLHSPVGIEGINGSPVGYSCELCGKRFDIRGKEIIEKATVIEGEPIQKGGD